MDLAECVCVGGTEVGVGALELLQQEGEQATVKNKKEGFFLLWWWCGWGRWEGSSCASREDLSTIVVVTCERSV